MSFSLKMRTVGPWPMNTYLLVCEQTCSSAIVDPGADPADILNMAQGTRVEKILVTHGHEDHVGALSEMCAATGAPVCLHPADGKHFRLNYDLPLRDGDAIEIGESNLRVVHAPGHTPGMCCFDLGDGRVLVGDTVFVGGPGKTWSAVDFSRQMRTMQEIVFAWPDEAFFYPGHGQPGRIGDERLSFEAFVKRGWSPEVFGDVTWNG